MTIRFSLLAALLLSSACSRMDTLTPALLDQAQNQWRTHRPPSYQMSIEMGGDRVETSRFDVTVQGDEVVGLRRNGVVLAAGQGQEYSMEGLFVMLRQELGLLEKPALLGAPAGYTVYPMVRFDPETGRLLRYRRTVGGTSNGIEIKVVDYGVK